MPTNDHHVLYVNDSSKYGLLCSFKQLGPRWWPVEIMFPEKHRLLEIGFMNMTHGDMTQHDS